MSRLRKEKQDKVVSCYFDVRGCLMDKEQELCLDRHGSFIFNQSLYVAV